MGICEDAPDEYCGHMLKREQKDIDSGLDVDGWNKEMNNAVCIREPAYNGRCVWHANTNEKTRKELIAARLKPEDVPWETEYVKEHLSGAILPGTEFPEGFCFGKCALIKAEIECALFPGANFQYARLREANLRGALFPGANFQHVRLREANISNARFPEADLREASFPKANLSRARFPKADLRKASFSEANLYFAAFPEADLAEAQFPEANLKIALFLEADLAEAHFYKTDLRGALFPGARLRQAQFHEANLIGAKFHDTKLFYTDFSDSKLRGAEFPEADLLQAQFSEAELNGANLTGASLREAEFSGADLRGVIMKPALATEPFSISFESHRLVRRFSDEIDLQEANHTNASPNELQLPTTYTTTNQRDASLEDAQLEDGTDLRGANLSGARLYQTAFRDVRINDETQFGIDADNKPGKACRYEYDPNTDVSITDDVSRLRAAARTHRRLESLFEENAMDQRAQNAHIRKQEAQRKRERTQLKKRKFPSDSWLESLREFVVKSVNWHLHRHGESLRQLLTMSGILIFFCGIGYSLGGIAQSNPDITYRLTIADFTKPWAVPIDLFNGLYFSIITFSTIGYGDFYPSSTLSRLLVGIESLFGALFIALFVFVIGRRVAR